MSIIWFIVAIFTGVGVNGTEIYQFEEPFFLDKPSCVWFVKGNFNSLNKYVNEVYEANPDTPNLFVCVNEEQLNKIIFPEK